MFQPKLLPEVLVALVQGLHLVDSLRKAGDSVEGLILPIHVVEDEVD